MSEKKANTDVLGPNRFIELQPGDFPVIIKYQDIFYQVTDDTEKGRTLLDFEKKDLPPCFGKTPHDIEIH